MSCEEINELVFLAVSIAQNMRTFDVCLPKKEVRQRFSSDECACEILYHMTHLLVGCGPFDRYAFFGGVLQAIMNHRSGWDLLVPKDTFYHKSFGVDRSLPLAKEVARSLMEYSLGIEEESSASESKSTVQLSKSRARVLSRMHIERVGTHLYVHIPATAASDDDILKLTTAPAPITRVSFQDHLGKVHAFDLPSDAKAGCYVFEKETKEDGSAQCHRPKKDKGAAKAVFSLNNIFLEHELRVPSEPFQASTTTCYVCKDRLFTANADCMYVNFSSCIREGSTAPVATHFSSWGTPAVSFTTMHAREQILDVRNCVPMSFHPHKGSWYLWVLGDAPDRMGAGRVRIPKSQIPYTVNVRSRDPRLYVKLPPDYYTRGGPSTVAFCHERNQVLIVNLAIASGSDRGTHDDDGRWISFLKEDMNALLANSNTYRTTFHVKDTDPAVTLTVPECEQVSFTMFCPKHMNTIHAFVCNGGVLSANWKSPFRKKSSRATFTNGNKSWGLLPVVRTVSEKLYTHSPFYGYLMMQSLTKALDCKTCNVSPYFQHEIRKRLIQSSKVQPIGRWREMLRNGKGLNQRRTNMTLEGVGRCLRQRLHMNESDACRIIDFIHADLRESLRHIRSLLVPVVHFHHNSPLRFPRPIAKGSTVRRKRKRSKTAPQWSIPILDISDLLKDFNDDHIEAQPSVATPSEARLQPIQKTKKTKTDETFEVQCKQLNRACVALSSLLQNCPFISERNTAESVE